jgi:hypothetical protein
MRVQKNVDTLKNFFRLRSAIAVRAHCNVAGEENCPWGSHNKNNNKHSVGRSVPRNMAPLKQ